MPIIYAVVSRGTTVLAEYSTTTGNFTTITRRILEKIQPGKLSYVYDRYVFHYSSDDTLTFLCMSDEEFSRRVAFAFLDDVKNRFKASYGDRGKVAVAYGMNSDFARVLQKQIEHYSGDPGAVDKISRVQSQVEDAKTATLKNIELLLDRGDKIELLVDKTEGLKQDSMKFATSSRKLKQVMWWKNFKLYIVLAVVLIILVYAIVCFACKGLLWQGCFKKKHQENSG